MLRGSGRSCYENGFEVEGRSSQKIVESREWRGVGKLLSLSQTLCLKGSKWWGVGPSWMFLSMSAPSHRHWLQAVLEERSAWRLLAQAGPLENWVKIIKFCPGGPAKGSSTSIYNQSTIPFKFVNGFIRGLTNEIGSQDMLPRHTVLPKSVPGTWRLISKQVSCVHVCCIYSSESLMRNHSDAHMIHCCP